MHWWYFYGDLILIIEITISITEWPIAVLVFMTLGSRTPEARGARASTREPFTVIKKGRPFRDFRTPSVQMPKYRWQPNFSFTERIGVLH